MLHKVFKSDNALMEFIEENDIEVISTHSTPGSTDLTNYEYVTNSLTFKVTLLYNEIKKEKKVMI